MFRFTCLQKLFCHLFKINFNFTAQIIFRHQAKATKLPFRYRFAYRFYP